MGVILAPRCCALGALELRDHRPRAASNVAHRHTPLSLCAAERTQLRIGDEQLAVRTDREMLAGKLRQIRNGNLLPRERGNHHVGCVDEHFGARVPGRMPPISPVSTFSSSTFLYGPG